MADRKHATCHPAKCTALIAAPPEENGAAAASTLRRAERGVGSGREGDGGMVTGDLIPVPQPPCPRHPPELACQSDQGKDPTAEMPEPQRKIFVLDTSVV